MTKNCQKILLCLVVFLISVSFLTGCFFETIVTRKRFYFPTQTEDSRSPLEFQTLMGTGNFENIMPTATGVYLFGKAKLYDFNPILDRGWYEDEILVRTNQEGKYLWGITLSYDDGLANSAFAVSSTIQNLVTNDQDNLYVSGHTERKKFVDKLVPKEKGGFVACINQDGNCLWATFFSKEEQYYNSKLTLINDKLYYSFITNVYIPSEDKDNPGEDTFTSRCLDPQTGKILGEKKTECHTDFDRTKIYSNSNGWYILQQSEEDVLVHSFSFDGTLQWKNKYLISFQDAVWYSDKVSSTFKAMDQPVSLSSRNVETYQLPLLVVSNSTHLFIIGSKITDEQNRETDDGELVRNYDSYILAISPDGKKLWKDKLPLDNKGILVNALCNEKTLFLVGKTSTEFLPTTKSSFQPKIAGKDDLFIQAIDMNGETQWSTYLGGKGEEPRYQQADYAWRSFYDISMDLEGDNLAVSTNTTSVDFPVIKANPRYVNSGSSYQTLSILSVFDLNGLIKWSTYYTIDATDEQIKNTQKSDFVPKQEQDEPLAQSIKIYQDRIYCISKTSNIHTLLFRPDKNWVSVKESDAKPDSDIFVNLFSAFRLK